MKETELSDISILSAHDVDSNLLLDFYNTMYPKRANADIWKWLNRSAFYSNKIPLVILYRQRVIAHAGMIPFKILLDGKYYKASWFIDFVVLPEFQRQGIGTLLTERWMTFSDLYVTFCNEKSMSVFKKFGWIESFNTYLHCYLLMPFNYPKFVGFIPLFLRKALNIVSRHFLNLLYYKYADSIDGLRLERLNLNSVDKFMAVLNMADNTVVPIRDSDYVTWRLLNSPDRDKYRIFSTAGNNDVGIIIKMCGEHHSKYIEILWVSNPSQYSVVRNMISTLAIWGMGKGYGYIRYYTSSKELSRYLSNSLKPIVNHPRFAFYAKDITLLEKLKHCNWHWELMDSDFERF